MRKIFVMFLGLFMLIFAPTIINAETDYFQEGSKERVVDHSLFTANQVVNSQETVKGLNFVAGNSIKVTGTNEYGIFAGNDITVSNVIEKDLFAAGNNIIISSDATIGRDVYVAGSNVVVNTSIEKNAFIAGSVVTLKDATLKGNVNIACQELVIEGVVTINGALTINEDAEIDNESNLMVDTKVTYDANDVSTNFNFTNKVVEVLMAIASLLIIGFAINGLFPSVYDKVLKDISIKNELKNLLLGLIALIIIPIVSIILLCTLVGALLGLILLLIYILMLIISLLYGSVVAGNLILTKLFKAKDNSYLSITVGIIALRVVSLIPYIGGLVYFLTFIYGMGKPIELFKNRTK